MPAHLGAIGCSAALALLAGCGGAASAPAASLGHGVVVAVVDGDTIVVRIAGRDEHVRLLGIDTPETVDPRKPVACFGHEASEHTKQLLPKGTAVRLERDLDARDKYARLLAYVYRQRDGLFVNLDLAVQGYADVLSIVPNVAHADELRAAVGEARSAGRGLWSACSSFGAPLAGKSG